MEPRLPLRQDSGHRLLLPPKGFRVPAGRGLGHGDIKIRLGTKRSDAIMASTQQRFQNSSEFC